MKLLDFLASIMIIITCVLCLLILHGFVYAVSGISIVEVILWVLRGLRFVLTLGMWG